MSILLSLLLSQARVLPAIDRRALDLQARAESLGKPAASQPVAVRRTSTEPSRRAAAATPVRRATVQPSAPAGFGRPDMPVLRRASGGAFDLSAITSICRAAGNQNDPASFLAGIGNAYNLSGNESSSLRTSCAAYLAGRAEARGTGRGR